MYGNYPTSSCPSSACPIAFPIDTLNRPENPGKIVKKDNGILYQEYLAPVGIPSSIGVMNGKIPPEYACTNKIKYAQSKQPILNSNGRQLVNLNEGNGLSFTPGFQKVVCDKLGDNNCRYSYASNDPRLLDPRRALITTLDRPPLDSDSSIYPDNVFMNPLLNNYGKNYRWYGDINTGSIMYYYDKTTANPYSSPNFIVRGNVSHILFKDPMGSIKPQYFKESFTNSLNYLSEDSFMRDSLSHRDDLMGRQMRKHNEQRFDMRYSVPN